VFGCWRQGAQESNLQLRSKDFSHQCPQGHVGKFNYLIMNRTVRNKQQQSTCALTLSKLIHISFVASHLTIKFVYWPVSTDARLTAEARLLATRTSHPARPFGCGVGAARSHLQVCDLRSARPGLSQVICCRPTRSRRRSYIRSFVDKALEQQILVAISGTHERRKTVVFCLADIGTKFFDQASH
jgi:hypothetical protein